MTRGVVASPHHLASEAGAAVLRQGGNAIDAAVAANAVLCVVYPHMTSLGGDLMALVWPACAPAPVGLVGAGRAGDGATADAMRALGHTTMPQRGATTVTVPGTVQSWGRLVERFGRMGLGVVMSPAAALAREGFIVSPGLAPFLSSSAGWRLAEPEHARLLPAVLAGMLLRNQDLAGVLDGIGRSGWLGFHRGELAASIARAVQTRGGFLSASDMGSHHSDWVEPLRLSHGGVDVYQLPPPTQGLVALGILSRLARLAPPALEPGPRFAAALMAARAATYSLRDSHLGDPDFSEIDPAPFLDAEAPAGLESEPVLPEGDTIQVCAADEAGNLISLMQSVAFDFGSGIIAEGTGIQLHNRGAYFSLEAGHPNLLAPGKRPMHTLIPAIVGRAGVPWAALGSMGGDGQPQLQIQVLLNLLAGMDPAQAVAAPRIRYEVGGTPLLVEADYPGAAELNRGPNPVHLMPPHHWRFGHAQAIVVDGPGAWRAGADPRSDGSVAVSP